MNKIPHLPPNLIQPIQEDTEGDDAGSVPRQQQTGARWGASELCPPTGRAKSMPVFGHDGNETLASEKKGTSAVVINHDGSL